MTICPRGPIVKPRAKLLNSLIIIPRFLIMRVTFKNTIFSGLMVSENETKFCEVLAKYDYWILGSICVLVLSVVRR